jgi:oxygen-dependent protoporphyrinogen oxidase
MSVARVVVVGAGVAGLAAAHWIRELARARDRKLSLTVLEATAAAGGVTRSERHDGWVCDHGPNGFLEEPPILELVAALGLAPRLERADARSRRRYVWRGGRLRELPTGLGGFLSTRALSARAKLRMALEPLVPARDDEADESIYDFARRRCGERFAAELLEPMVSGVFAGDPHALSLASALPRLHALERDHGGLARGMMALARARRLQGGPAGPGGTLSSFPDGMGELTTALGRALGPDLVLGSAVRGLERSASHFVLRQGGIRWVADAVVLGCPAHAAAPIVEAACPPVGRALATIAFAPVTVVCRGHQLGDLGRPLDGFGVLAARGEGIRSLGTLCADRIFPGHAPAGHRLLRTLFGGARDLAAAALDDRALATAVDRDHARLFRPTAPPVHGCVFRHERAIAQYTLGHARRLEEIAALERAWPGLYFTGGSYRGVSVSACVADARAVAERLWRELAVGRAA